MRDEAGLGFEPWSHWLCLPCFLGGWCPDHGGDLGPMHPPFLPSMSCTQGESVPMP